jgi:hypothetical protein
MWRASWLALYGTGEDVRLRRGRRAVAPEPVLLPTHRPATHAPSRHAKAGPRRVCGALPAGDRHTFISSPGDLPALCLLDR